MVIEKKAVAPYFEYVLSGKKNFDLRLADFECKPGDILYLREWDPKTKEYTGRELKRQITFVGKWKLEELFWPKKDIEKYGLQVISLMAVDKHKLNTPLTVIYGYVQMLGLKSENLTDSQKEWVEEMRKETKRLIEMIKEL